MLSDAPADKRSVTRLQALAALRTLPEPLTYALTESALADTGIDTRTTAVLACRQTHGLRLIGKLHAMLDDKEPQVAFAAAAGDRKANAADGEGVEGAASE